MLEDPGSTHNLITHQLARDLGLARKKSKLRLRCLKESTIKVRGLTESTNCTRKKLIDMTSRTCKGKSMRCVRSEWTA